MTKQPTDNIAVAEKNESTNTPPLNKRRILFGAMTPVLLIGLLTVGMRMATESAKKQEAEEEKFSRAALRDSRNAAPRPRPVFLPADKPTQKLMEATVRGQIAAFGAGDFKKALTYADPNFRNAITPERFAQMVHGGYTPLTDAEMVSLKTARVQGKKDESQQGTMEAVIQVRDGQNAYYSYMLIGRGGQWTVQGVVPHPAPDRAMEGHAPPAPARSRAAKPGNP